MTSTEQIYLNGDIITMNPCLPFAQAIAVKDGKIVGVGGPRFCRNKLGDAPKEIDLKGKALLPGFIDTHIHPTLMMLYEIYTDCTNTSTPTELYKRLTEVAKDKPSSEWILGVRFDEQFFDEPVLPTRKDLDQVCPDHPLVLLKRDGHSLIANSRAINEAGITANTKDPEGGSIDRESDGSPSGMFRESAMGLIVAKIPLPNTDSITTAVDSVFKKITNYGITAASVILQTGSEGIMGEQGAFDIPLMEMVLDRIPISMYSMLVAENAAAVIKARESSLHQPSNAGHQIGAFKLWMDGSFGSCTALMKEPFTDEPSKSGILMDEPDEIYKKMVDAHTAGLQLAVHSIGDESSRICLELFDRLLKEHPKHDHRHRVEHASILDKSLIKEFSRLHLVASVQPMFLDSEKNWLHKRLGAERAKWTYPFRSMMKGGIIMSGSSDAPIEVMDVLHAIQCCVTREGFETQEAMDAEDALKMFTLNAAFAQFQEGVRGSLATGKRADLVILEENPLKVPSNEIKNIPILETICGGSTV